MAERIAAVQRLPDGTVEVRVAGEWRLSRGIPGTAALAAELADAPADARIVFDAQDLGTWDTSLVLFASRVRAWCQEVGRAPDLHGLPDGVRRLLALAEAQPARAAALPTEPHHPPLERIGLRTAQTGGNVARSIAFVGETSMALGRFVRGRAHTRPIDILREMQMAGIAALPIVSVVAFLLGLIMAFVGGVTLRQFGALLYVADVVTIGIVREMGPIMTAIVMAGRTGSAYAAQLGTMRVNDEIEALSTMALPPMDFLVVPRMLALCLMLPLLAVYADFVALLGGGIMSMMVLGLGGAEYYVESKTAITLSTFTIGVSKSAVFGVLVALCGCGQGMRAGKSAAAVGDAATGAVVASIVWIIVADGVFAVLLYLVGY